MKRIFTIGLFLLGLISLLNEVFAQNEAIISEGDIPHYVSRSNVHLFEKLLRSQEDIATQESFQSISPASLKADNDSYVDIVLAKSEGEEVRFEANVPDEQIEGLNLVRVEPDPDGGSHNIRIYQVKKQNIRIKGSTEKPLTWIDTENTGIRSFDASHCETLEEFYANNNPELSKMDFSKNPRMRIVAAAFTQIDEVNVKGLKALSILAVAPAALSELDVTGCDALSFALIFGNRINDNKMTDFITSLPDLTATTNPGMLFVVDENPVTFEERNRCSVAHVTAAVRKGWGVFNEARKPYRGYDYAPSYSDDVITFQTSIKQNNSIFMRIEGKDNADVFVDGAEYWQRKNERDEYILKKKTVTLKGKVGYLDISGCEITDLNISGNLHLTTLRCADNPAIKTLDLSQHKDLEYIDIKGTNIASINVSNAKGLKSLKCATTKINKLDLSKATQLEVLHAANNTIRQVDLSVAKKLKELTISGCYLTKLDLTNNPLLEMVQVHDNSLSELLFTSDKLRRISVFGNQIKGEAMTAMIKSLPTAEKGDIEASIVIFSEGMEKPDGNVCTESDVREALSKNWKVKKIDANYNEHDYPGITALADVVGVLAVTIYPNPAQEYVILSGVQKGDKIELRTIEGVSLWKSVTEQDSLRIDLSTYPSGWYLLYTPQKTQLLRVDK